MKRKIEFIDVIRMATRRASRPGGIRHNEPAIDVSKAKDLPPKPGEPETWEKFELIKDRFVINTKEDLKNAMEELNSLREKAEDKTEHLDGALAFTPYEKEVLVPMSNQIIFDITQIVSSRLYYLYGKIADDGTIQMAEFDDEKVNRTIQTEKARVSNIMKASKWAKGMRKRR